VTAGPTSSAAAPAVALHPATELVVVIACHGLLCTLPVRWVERLLLREAVSLHAPPGRRPRDPSLPLPQVVYAAEEPFAAWNLGTMLALPPVSTAWVLLRVGPEHDPVPIALRTGPCLIVQPAPASAPLPAALFRERGAGIVGAFSTAQLRGKPVGTSLGLSLDPQRFWSEQELAGSRAAVAAAYPVADDVRES
jgi:hypothetical protein